MPAPARRSRRTRNEPPEIVPPKSDGEGEDNDEEGDEEEEDEQKDDDQGGESEKSGADSSVDGKSGPSARRSAKAKKTGPSAKTRRAARTSRKPTTRGPRKTSSPVTTRRRKRRTSNSSDEQPSKGDEDASSGEGSEAEADEPAKPQTPPPTRGRRRVATKGKQRQAAKNAKSGDEESKGGNASSGSDQDEGGEEKDDAADDSDSAAASTKKSNDEEGSKDDDNEDEDSSDNEPLSVIVKRKREALKKKQAKSKHVSSRESSVGDDQSEDERPRKRLGSAASSGNDDGGDADAESDSVTPKKKNARAKPRQKRQTRTTKKVGSAKSSGDEGDADEPPHKRTRRRGRTNKAVSSPKGKASSAVSTNDEGSSDESSKGGSRRRGPRSTMSRSKSRSTSPVEQDGEKDKDDNASSNDDKSLVQKEGDDASESKVEEQDETGSMEKDETKKSMDVDESSEPDEKAIKNKNEKPRTRQARSRSNSVADEDASGEERGSEAETSRVSRRSRRKRRKPNKLGEEDSADEQEATSKPAASEPNETKAEEEDTSSDKEESHRPRRKGSKSGQGDDESDSKDANVSEKLKKEASRKVENESVTDKISEGADERAHAGADEPEPKNVEPVDSGDEDDAAENNDVTDELRSKVDGRSAAPADEEESNVIQVGDEAKDHDSAHPNDTKQPPSKGDDDDVDSEEMKPESEDAEKSEAEEGSKTGDFQNGTTLTTVDEISAPEAVNTIEQKDEDESAASEERIVKDATMAETPGSPVESKAVAGDVELQRLRKESPRHTVKSPEASTPHGAGAEDAVPVAEHPPTTDETESKEMTIEPNNVQGDNVVAEQSIEVTGEAKPLSPSGEGDEDKADDQVVDKGSIPGHSVTTEVIAADVKDQDAKADSIVEEKDTHLLEEPEAGSSSIESAHKRLSEMPSVEGAGPHESLDVDAPAPLDTESPTVGPSATADSQPTAPAEDKTSEQEAQLSVVDVPTDFTKTDKDVEKSELQTAGEPVGSDSAEEARRLTPEVEASLQSKSLPMVKTEEEEEDQFHDAHMEMPSEPPSAASLAGATEIGNPNLQGQAQRETDGLSFEAPKESLPAAASEEGATSALVQGNDNGNVLEAKKSDPVSSINKADGVATEPDSAKPVDISAAPRIIGPIEASIRASFQKQRSGGMSSPNAIARIDASKATTNLVQAAATARTEPMAGMKPIEAVQLETVQKIGVTGASLTATPSPPALTETTELDSGNTATIANGPDERDTLHADPMVVAQHMQTSFAHSANASFPFTGAPPVVLARNVSELQPSHFVPSAVETATATAKLSIEAALEQPIPQLATKAGDLGPKIVQSVEASDDPNDAKQKEPSETPKMKRRFVGTPMKSPEAIPELLPVPLEFEYKVRFGPPPIQEDAEEPLMVSPMDLFDKDKLKRVKTVLYATGSRAHRGSGFERIFAEYWDAMALRLSDRLSSHTSERCQRAIDNFLKTPKLRKLHNKFIMSIMRRAQRDVATYGEVSVHVPMKWRTRIKTVSAPPVEKFQERLPGVSSSLNTPMFGSAEPCYREAWDQPKPHINPLGNERRRQKTLITPKPEIASCSLPGALTIDPLVRKIAEEDGMEVSDLAIWLMVVAVKEHAGNVLKTSIAHKEAIEQSDLPPRPLAFPRPLAGSITLHTKPDLPLDGKSILADKGTRMSRTLNALDIYASLGTMPMGHIGSLGGSFSRSTLERSLHASFDQLSVVPKDNFTHVQNYIIDQIFAEARTRKVPPKPRDDDREPRAPLENHVNAKASPMMRHQNSFAVPPPAPAQPRAVDISTAANVQPIPASAQPLTTAPVVAPGTNTAAATSVAETEALNAMPRGMGRGAKNLAALMRRTATSNSPGPEDSNAGPAPESKGDDTTPAEPSPQVAPPPATTAAPTNLPSEESKGNDEGEDAGGQRRGKGFGIKNLARMLAKKDVDPADN